MCSAIETSGEQEAEALRRLVERQLPQITERLQTTLDKLAVKSADKVEWIAATKWWGQFQQRYAFENLAFETAEVPESTTLPAELFDSVADNLINNALAKRQVNPVLSIQVRMEWNGKLALSVTDNGPPVPGGIASKLFLGPVPSSRGLGVGLYQASRQAHSLGFTLTLAKNTHSSVSFVLSSELAVG